MLWGPEEHVLEATQAGRQLSTSAQEPMLRQSTAGLASMSGLLA